MFRLATQQNTPRSRPNVGVITPLRLPVKGLNTRDALAAMGPDSAINLSNVLVDSYGLRTRKGYIEWAINLPSNSNVSTVMNYYPATIAPVAAALGATLVPPVGKLFAATNGGRLYDVTAGGVGPWASQAGVLGPSDFWSWLNFQNVAGSFLIIANH